MMEFAWTLLAGLGFLAALYIGILIALVAGSVIVVERSKRKRKAQYRELHGARTDGGEE